MRFSRWTFFLWLGLALCPFDSALARPDLKTFYYELCGPLVASYAKKFRLPDFSHDSLAMLIQMGFKSWTEEELRVIWEKVICEKQVEEDSLRYLHQFPPLLKVPAAHHYYKDRARAWGMFLGKYDYALQDHLGIWVTDAGYKFLDAHRLFYEFLEHEIAPDGFPDIVPGNIKVPLIGHSQLAMVGSVYRLEKSNRFEKINPAILQQDLLALYEKPKIKEIVPDLEDTFARDLDFLIDRHYLSRVNDNLTYNVSGREQLQRAFSLYFAPDEGLPFSHADLMKVVRRRLKDTSK